ncbi:dna polymerase epsilon [Stylonychia lemnae]|uniref:Dna polymerase epsilon n=1 Tax=Stylonychia lemnae TaxID=5949 RepID=A0A078BD07_STYLE|nr:dna polymerase epsilon [Stylonychia lemnae]|eukprot:CDW91478.1 dna polymerase epsilon [Stylonychia lemnae]
MAENLDFQEIEDDFDKEKVDIDLNNGNDHENNINDTKSRGITGGQPKKPSSGFQLFIASLKSDTSFKESLGPNSRQFLQEASKRWNEIDLELKQTYLDRAQQQKEQYQQWKEQHKELRSKSRNNLDGEDEIDYIDNENDEEAQSMRKMFVQDLGGVCGQIAKMQKRKTIFNSDIISAASNIDKFHFIKDSKLPALNPKKQEEKEMLKEISEIVENEQISEDQQLKSGQQNQDMEEVFQIET